MCGWKLEPSRNYAWNISLRFSSNSEAFASVLLENIKEVFIGYW